MSAARSLNLPRGTILLISIDTLRADHVGRYGYGRPTSPAIDRLATEGIVFKDVSAPLSGTLPEILWDHDSEKHDIKRAVRHWARLDRSSIELSATLSDPLRASHPRSLGRTNLSKRAKLIRIAPLVACLALLGWGCTAQPAGMRVVLITLDTLRYDSLMAESEGHSSMPLLLERAKRGAIFTRFYSSSSVTQPAHASMFTALHPWQHGVTRNGQVLSDEHQTIAERLRSAGFETTAVVASFPLTQPFGYAQGFDTFAAQFDQRKRRVDVPWEEGWEVPEGVFYSLARSVNQQVMHALDAGRGDQQFFWFHYYDPHSPYGANGDEALNYPQIWQRIKARGERVEEVMSDARALYGIDLAALDAALERLFVRLARDADRFETHIVVVSDHGESFGEGGRIGHGSSLSVEQIHVPAFILSPKVETGWRSDIASSVDIPKTLLSLAGLDAAGDDFGGRDLTLDGELPAGVFGMRRTYQSGSLRQPLLDGSFEQLAPYWFFLVDSNDHLYRGNREEVRGLDGAAPPDLERDVTRLFRGFEEEMGRGMGPAEAVDPETRRALEALGYVP